MGSYFPDQVLNLGSQQLKAQSPIIGLPFPNFFFFLYIITLAFSSDPFLNLSHAFYIFFFFNACFFRLIAQVWELLGEMSTQGGMNSDPLSPVPGTILSPGLATSTSLCALLPPWPLHCLFPTQKPGGAVEN